MATALVLSAGGMFAAWEVGAWKALQKRFRPDMIVGASAGAWNGWLIAGGCTPDELIREWLRPENANIMRFGLHPAGVLHPEMLHQVSRKLFERFQPHIPFALTLAQVPLLRPRLVRGPEVTWQHLAAACAIPFGFPPVRIESKYYVDGGLLGAVPFWAAEEMGADCAIALNALTTMPFRILRAVLPRSRPSRSLKVMRVEPSQALGSLYNAVFWSRSNIERWIEQGERDGNRATDLITM